MSLPSRVACASRPQLVEMLRRFVLVGMMAFWQDSMLQLALGVLLSAAFLCARARVLRNPTPPSPEHPPP